MKKDTTNAKKLRVGNVKEEGDVIKQTLTRKPVKYPFIGIAEAAPIGFSLSNVTRNMRVNYVPDFYIIGEILNVYYQLLINDSKFKRNKNFDIYGWYLYHFHVIFYLCLRSHNNGGYGDEGSRRLQFDYECAGIQESVLPIFLNKYIEGLGSYKDPYSGVNIELNLGKNEIKKVDEIFYILNYKAAHLLPNFRLILINAYFMSPHSTNTCPIRDRVYKNFSEPFSEFSVPWFSQLTECRTQASVFPGCKNLTEQRVSKELTAHIHSILNYKHSSTWHKYVQFDPSMLKFLAYEYIPIINKIDHF